MRIGELARRSGVGERLLRYYEQRGLLRPRRQGNGYREYAADDVRTVRRIRLLLAAGLPTATIARALPCVADDAHRLVPTCAEVIPDLRAERERVDRQIADLRASRDRLDAVLGAYRWGDLDS